MVALGTLVYSVLVSVWMHRFSQCKANPGKLFHTGHFKGFIVGRRLTDALITKIPGIDFRNCTRECSIRKRCRSINFLSRFPLCEINHGDISENRAVVVNDPHAVYTEKPYWANEEMTHESCNGIACFDLNSKCQVNMKSSDTACVPSDCGDIPEIPNATAELSDGIGVFSKVTFVCGIYYEAVGDKGKISCLPEGTWSTTTFQCKERVFVDCLTLKKAGISVTGVYKIHLWNSQINVTCDMDTEGGGWTILHARSENNLNYGTKGWNEYKLGFGAADSDYWIGNEYIHLLTKDSHPEVYFKLQHLNGTWYHAKYREFYVEPEGKNYRLHFKANSYNGTAGYYLHGNNNCEFSTLDNDNDHWEVGSCASLTKGAWWFDYCSEVLLITSWWRWCRSCGYLGTGQLKASYIMVRH